ncbi:MAG: OmpH family outer membrane protein [Pyrinomonadaceae bacterium]
MKRFSLIAVSFIFAAIFSISAFGQVPAATGAAGKIGLVNISAFADDKAGIAKFRTALTTLDAEFKVLNDEINTMRTKYQTLATEIQKAQQAPPAGVPVKDTPAALAAKVEEAQNLEIQIKRKQEDGKARYERRYPAVVGPVFNDIIKALNDYARQKGFAIILDGAKLEQAEILLGFDDKYDVTKDFIVFYNARPAGTATTATPK